MQENVVSAAARAVGDGASAEVNANDPPGAPKLALQSLFSLIRGEVEELDSTALPLCLHQVGHEIFHFRPHSHSGTRVGNNPKSQFSVIDSTPSVTDEPRRRCPWISG